MLCSLPLIVMMQASHFRPGHHLACVRRLNRSGLRTIHIEGKMGTISVVIGDIRGEHSPEMLVIQDDDMIEYIATSCTVPWLFLTATSLVPVQ